MQYTKSFNLPLLHQNQAMKEVVINEAISKLGGLLNNSIMAEAERLPENARDNQLYLLTTNDKELTYHKNDLAFYHNGKWEFIKPQDGMIFFLRSKNKFTHFKENAWINV